MELQIDDITRTTIDASFIYRTYHTYTYSLRYSLELLQADGLAPDTREQGHYFVHRYIAIYLIAILRLCFCLGIKHRNTLFVAVFLNSIDKRLFQLLCLFSSFKLYSELEDHVSGFYFFFVIFADSSLEPIGDAIFFKSLDREDGVVDKVGCCKRHTCLLSDGIDDFFLANSRFQSHVVVDFRYSDEDLCLGRIVFGDAVDECLHFAILGYVDRMFLLTWLPIFAADAHFSECETKPQFCKRF